MGQDEETTHSTLTAYRKIIDGLIDQHHGRFVNSAGDSVLAEFASVVNAVQCAVETQGALKEENANLPSERRMELRIGINLGDVIVDDEQIYGDGVNVAARLESLAAPGGICISGTVYEQIRDKLALHYEDLGEQEVKNILRPVRVFRVLPKPDAAAPRKIRTVTRKYVWLGVVSMAGLAIIVAALMLVQHHSLSPPAPSGSIPLPQTPALALPDKPSIVVLPFANMSGDRDQEYFSDGITEDLTSDLSRLPGLFVIARNSAFAYKGKPVNLQDVSRELGVRYALEGSVRKADNRVRITAQLVDATTDYQIWGDRYDRPLEDIFALQDEIVQQIITNLKVKVLQAELARVSRIATNNLTAYDSFLRGGELLRRVVYETNKEANRQARQMFDRAIELDSQYGAAYAALSATYFNDWFFQWDIDPAQSLGRALEVGQRAVTSDDSLPAAHSVLSTVYLWRKQHDRAAAEAERTIDLDANSAEGYDALGNVLAFAGRPLEAMPLFNKAMRLDPRNRALYLNHLGFAYRVADRCEEALIPLKEAIALTPDNYLLHIFLAGCYVELGQQKEAHGEAVEAMRLNPNYSLEWASRNVPFKDLAARDRFFAVQRKAGLK
jgi:adenylate cyclase